MKRILVLGCTLFSGSLCLQAQEPWDSSIQLTGIAARGMEKAYLGQEKGFGVGFHGAYPLTQAHILVFEAGYRVFGTQGHGTPDLTIDDKTDGYFGGAGYRFQFYKGTLDGLYLQGGLRFAAMLTERKMLEPGGASDGGDLRTSIKGSRVNAVVPVVGAGFRFTERLSLEVNLAGLKAENIKGEKKSGAMVELTLGMHF